MRRRVFPDNASFTARLHRRKRNDGPTSRFAFCFSLAKIGRQLFNIEIKPPRELLTVSMNFSDDLVLSHDLGFQQFGGSANNRTRKTKPSARRFDSPFEF